MKIIRVENLTFEYSLYHQVVLDHISFDIEEGSYVALVGPNGSGKSTLARLLVGLLNANEGDIYIFDKKLTKENYASLIKKIGIVFQNPDNQFVGATVEDDIAFGLENQRVERTAMYDIVKTFASKVGMLDFLDKEPSNLSGGQKQRVAIAGVLALSPKILILDEATAMLDPKGKSDILRIIQDIKKDNPSLTVISITHDLNEALLADQVIAINNGKIIFNGAPSELFSKGKELADAHLKLPFLFELKESFKKAGINIDSAQSIEEVINKLCR